MLRLRLAPKSLHKKMSEDTGSLTLDRLAQGLVGVHKKSDTNKSEKRSGHLSPLSINVCPMHLVTVK
jgi:hypothetical protein